MPGLSPPIVGIWEDDEATPLPKNPEILMYSLVSAGYTHDFSPLEHFSKDGANHAPKIPKRMLFCPQEKNHHRVTLKQQ